MPRTFALFLIFLLVVTAAPRAVAAAVTSPLTLWAAVRKDGVAGTGTMQNPYDASTEAKFDALLENLLAANGAQRIILHLKAGTYTVTPVLQLSTTANPAGYTSNIPGNFEIIGAGETMTTIRAGIVPTGNATYWVFTQIGDIAGVDFENLTIDCNIQNQTAPNLTIDGIQFLHVAGAPTHSLASYVHVIHGGNHPGDPGDTEWFGIAMNDATPDSVSEVTHCRIDNYQGKSGCTAISATTEITDNVVTLNNNDPDGLLGNGPGGGFQNAFSPSGTVSGNVCHQCTYGVYSDVDNQVNENIEGNILDALYAGVMIYNWSANATINNVSVHGNTIVKSYSAAVILGTAATTVVNSNLSIYDNLLETQTSPNLPTNNLIYLIAAQNSEVYGNKFSVLPSKDIAMPTSISFPGCDLSTIAWYDNKFINGVVIPGPAGTVNHGLGAAVKPAP